MSLRFDVWPPEAEAVVGEHARNLRRVYGSVAGPVREQLIRLASSVVGEDREAESLVDGVVSGLSPAPSAHLAGRPFGPAELAPGGDWPSGPYSRCSWNPLHLIRVADEPSCLVCETATEPPGELEDLIARPEPYLESSGVGWRPNSQVPLMHSQLEDQNLLKIGPRNRAWVVTLNADGSLMERPLGDGGFTGESWRGEWGCDSYGLLVMAVSGYQLAVRGASDGVCQGWEFLHEPGRTPEADQRPGPVWHFVVGVIDAADRGYRAIKWLPGPGAFRLTRSDSAAWHSAGPLDEADLWPAASGRRETWSIVRSADPYGSLRLQSPGPDGEDYEAALQRANWPAGTWMGVEACAQTSTQSFVFLAPVAPLSLDPVSSHAHGGGPHRGEGSPHGA